MTEKRSLLMNLHFKRGYKHKISKTNGKTRSCQLRISIKQLSERDNVIEVNSGWAIVILSLGDLTDIQN